MAISFLGNSQLSLGFGYAGTHPLGNLLTNKYKDGNGIDLYLLSKTFPQYSKIQAQIGVDFNVFSTGERKLADVPTTTGYNADYYLNNYHHALSFKTRLITQENTFRYHVDLDFGYRTFYTTQSLAFNQNITNHPPNYAKFIKEDNAYFTGITAGVIYEIAEWFALDLYSRVDIGKSATWLDLNSFSPIGNSPNTSTLVYKSTETPILWVGFSTIFKFKPPKFNRIPVSREPNTEQETYPTPETPSEPTPRGRVPR